MSEEAQKSKKTEENPSENTNVKTAVKLSGGFASKIGMSTVFNDKGEAVPVTVLKFDAWTVTQIKTKEKDGYSAIQLASTPKKAVRSNKASVGHLKKSGFEHSAAQVREMRQELPEGVEIGQRTDMAAFKKGDFVKVTGVSRGRGFSGVVRRWNFAGGPASHGSGFHRKPGSVGNRTWPGRVMAGKRMAGRYGGETVTVKNLEIVDVLLEESVLLIKGAVPGHRNSLVKLMKV
ncbi:MAG: 50S ribosomal protein L3 [Bdellovibrionales bacterium]|nr:50S ribosomal protein L3 [Bdellovibrionales bacterium]